MDRTEIVETLKVAVSCILDAARDGGELGSPSGVIFAVLSAHGMSLNNYQQIVSSLVQAGRITVENDCIILVKDGG